MAKKIKFTPKQSKSIDDDILGGFIELLRAVVDGDKEAKQTLRMMLDVFDKYGFNLPSQMMGNIVPNSDGAFDKSERDSPFTLKRTHVREMHIRIKLNDIGMKIWRELRVPSNLSLTAFGEEYQFCKGNEYFVSMESMEDSLVFGSINNNHVMDECTVDELLTEKGKRVAFEYDFGDGWDHDVWLKGEREYAPDEAPSVTFVKGQGACPPEDCGGVWEYEELLELRNKKRLSKDEREQLAWYFMDGDFDPDECDSEEIEELMHGWTSRLRGEKR